VVDLSRPAPRTVCPPSLSYQFRHATPARDDANRLDATNRRW
jgi:hypothetical protein